MSDPAESVVFVLAERGAPRGDWRVLMERRREMWLFPATVVAEGEWPSDALARGLHKELGVSPLAARRLDTDAPVLCLNDGHVPRHRMLPFLVTRWGGTIPPAALDTGRPLAWRRLHDAAESPQDPIARTARAALLVVEGGDQCPTQP